MSNLITISGVRGYIDENSTAHLHIEDVSRGLGFTRVAESGNEVVRWERVDGYLKDLGVPTCGHDDFIPENIFYRLAMKAKNETAEAFQAKVADEILPQIRKTGTYSLPQLSQLEILAQVAQAAADQEKQIKQIAATQAEQAEQLQGIRDVVALSPNDWRKDTSALINKMALSMGGYEHVKPLRAESYKLLDERLGVDLQCRLTNKRRRMADEGVCKSKRDKLNQLDVIADDKKLIEGYVAIVKEMAIKYGAKPA